MVWKKPGVMVLPFADGSVPGAYGGRPTMPNDQKLSFGVSGSASTPPALSTPGSARTASRKRSWKASIFASSS